MKAFNIDSKFNRTLNELTDLLILNLLWLLTSLSIVTVGASTAAMYGVLGRIDREEGGGIASNYFRYFGREWKVSTLYWLIQLAATAVLLYNFLSMYNAENPLGQLIAWLSFAAMLIIDGIFTLIYPMIVRYQNKVGEYLHNAAILFRTNVFRCLLQLLILSIPFLTVLYLEEMFLHTIPVWLLFGVSVPLKSCAALQKRIFEPLNPGEY